MMCCLQDQLARIDALRTEIDQLEHRIAAWQRQDAACSAIAAVPGIGKLTATALVATMGDAATFKSGREFAAFLGLVPRQSGTGGKVRLGSISKRGDPYLRTLLIHGARSVLYDANTLSERHPSAKTSQRRCRCGCKQDGSDRMAHPRARTGIRARSRQRQASLTRRIEP
jgi:transposase